MNDKRLLYWDADVFISYLNKDPQRLPIIEAILDEVLKIKEAKINQ